MQWCIRCRFVQLAMAEIYCNVVIEEFGSFLGEENKSTVGKSPRIQRGVNLRGRTVVQESRTDSKFMAADRGMPNNPLRGGLGNVI